MLTCVLFSPRIGHIASKACLHLSFLFVLQITCYNIFAVLSDFRIDSIWENFFEIYPLNVDRVTATKNSCSVL